MLESDFAMLANDYILIDAILPLNVWLITWL